MSHCVTKRSCPLAQFSLIDDLLQWVAGLHPVFGVHKKRTPIFSLETNQFSLSLNIFDEPRGQIDDSRGCLGLRRPAIPSSALCVWRAADYGRRLGVLELQHSSQRRNKNDRTIPPTEHARNPFGTTLKPGETIACWQIYRGIIRNRGFLGGAGFRASTVLVGGGGWGAPQFH